MTRYEELRAKSIDGLSLAQKAGNPVVRKELMQLAARFRQLAEHVKGNENEQEPVTAAAVIEAQRKRQVRRRRPQG